MGDLPFRTTKHEDGTTRVAPVSSDRKAYLDWLIRHERRHIQNAKMDGDGAALRKGQGRLGALQQIREAFFGSTLEDDA